MKNKLNKILGLSAVLLLGASFSLNVKAQPDPLLAVAHTDNFDEYTYTGNYYSSLGSNLTEGLNGTLRTSLATLVFPKGWYTYSGSSSGTLGNILQSADEDPTNKSNMILLYTRDSITKSGSTVNNKLIWNREHVWPQNLSNNHWGKEEAGADLLHIRPTYETTNSARSNTRYGDNNKTGVQKYEGMPYAYTTGAYFEPIDAVKGDVARILMYIWTTYYDYYKDSSLLVTKAIESYDVLLKWHTMDKPDALEGNRNNFCETSKQKNRNPFVDHPEYAWQIFGDSASAEVKNACKEAYPVKDAGSVAPTPTSSSSSPESVATTGSIENIPQPNSPTNRFGCNGSIIGAASMTSFTTLVALVFILSKKKK